MVTNLSERVISKIAEEHPVKDDAKSFNTESKRKANEDTIIYITIILLTYYHLAGFYGLYLCFTSAKWATIGFSVLTYSAGILGVTAGAHRLWSHRSYKAKLPLQVLLMLFHSIAYQKSVIGWSKDHRLHHKFSDTDADPHNARRGLFFSHIGWLMTRKTEEFITEEKRLDLSDLKSNPILRFQHKYQLYVVGACGFVLPTIIPMYFWGETLINAWHVNMLRFIVAVHVTFSVNSFAHKYGYKRYDKDILSSQNIPLAIFAFGEGFHNFHHTFPWDYQTSELGNRKLNFTTIFINFFSWLGLAYDLKTVTKEVLEKRIERTGDGTDLWGRMKSRSADCPVGGDQTKSDDKQF